MLVEAWTLTATAGAVASAWALRDAWLDLRALPSGVNGRRMLNRGHVRREAIRLGIQASWALIGVLAWLQGATGNANLGTLLLLGTNVAVAANTILDLRERYRIRWLLGGVHG